MAIQRTGNAFAQPHDPNDETDYTFRFRLRVGESVTNASIQVIDPATDQPPVLATDLVIANVSFGVMTDNDNVGLWGVTCWISGGTPSNSYWIRCQITTDSSPVARVFTRTVRLLCADQ